MLLHIIILLSYNHEFVPKNWELKKWSHSGEVLTCIKCLVSLGLEPRTFCVHGSVYGSNSISESFISYESHSD